MHAFVTLTAALSLAGLPALAQNSLPDDADPSCAVSEDAFETWIATPGDLGLSREAWERAVDARGLVFTPPASFSAAFDSDCDFYEWSAQMFLWLTSPSDGGVVFDDIGFYDVVHAGTGSEKSADVALVPNGDGRPNRFVLRSVKADVRGGIGQAGGGDVLLTRSGALTYYGMHVNDAYAAFRLGATDGPEIFDFVQSPNAQDMQFPSRSQDMNLVASYGVARGLIADETQARHAGTLEIKTSWVPVEAVGEGYITIEALVPGYDQTSGDTLWPQTEPEMQELAMVGMHIAGPVTGHAELVWASFEHLSNGPINSYVYTRATGGEATVPYDGTGTWTFAAENAPLPEEITATAALNSAGAIAGIDGGRILPVDAVQMNPWGNAPGSSDPDVVSNNTDLISLNARLMAYLQGDPAARDRYYQLGAVWTDGAFPIYPDVSNNKGGLRLANSTMETFHQFGAQKVASPGGFEPQNCLACHGVSGSGGAENFNLGISVSHIFQDMTPPDPAQ